MARREESRRADRVARRLHGELIAFVAGLPRDSRNASGLARLLDIDRTTCQRAVFVASRPYAGVEILARLPGVRGLRQLADAAGRSGVDDAVVAGLAAAIDQLESLLRSFGGSQSRLLRELAEPEEPSEGSVATSARGGGTEEEPNGLSARRRLHDAAAELTGRSSNCWVAIYLYRPLPGDPGRVELIRANGLVGHAARMDAVPLVMHNFTTRTNVEEDAGDPGPLDGRFLTLDGRPLSSRFFDSVLPEFTSDPLPIVSTRQPNEYLVQSFDERDPASGRAVDIMMATRTTMISPARRTPPVEEAWALVNFPCRHLVFDIHLHRDLARACLPSLDVHLWRPDFAQHVGDRWQTRFADAPTLQLLRPGQRVPAAAGYPRLPELTRTIFARAGLAAGEFIGYRCEVAYPIWRTGYCVALDFAPATTELDGAAQPR